MSPGCPLGQAEIPRARGALLCRVPHTREKCNPLRDAPRQCQVPAEQHAGRKVTQGKAESLGHQERRR